MEHGESTLVSLSLTIFKLLSAVSMKYTDNEPWPWQLPFVSRQSGLSQWYPQLFPAILSRGWQSYMWLPLPCVSRHFVPRLSQLLFPAICFAWRHSLYFFCHHFTSLCSTTITSSRVFPVENSTWNKELCGFWKLLFTAFARTVF